MDVRIYNLQSFFLRLFLDETIESILFDFHFAYRDFIDGKEFLINTILKISSIFQYKDVLHTFLL